MGVDISVPGENSFASPSPIIHFILPVESFRPLSTVSETPLGNVQKMKYEKEGKEYLVKTAYLDLGHFDNSMTFFREVQNHSLSFFPTILPFAGFSVANPHSSRRPAVVFEAFSGRKLSQVLEICAKKKTVNNWDLTAKIRTCLGIAAALNFLHSYGFIHGSVNADNVVFGDDLWPMLADFTLTYYFEEGVAQTLATEKTRLWRAPELICETDRTKKADVFAFAMLMLHVFAGKAAYEAIENSPDIQARIMANDRPKVSDDIAPEIKKIIQLCWAPNPDDRPTMCEVVKHIEEIISVVPEINMQCLEKFREKLRQASEDIAKARNTMQIANSGNVAAQNNLGVMLLNGKGVRKNVDAAARYFQASADQGCVEGMHNCGFALENGAGLPKNIAAAAMYFKAAADRGLKTAQTSYAQMLVKGSGIEKNCEEAAKYFKMAAQQNHAPAQYKLGLLYETGDGIAQNINEALNCYRASSALKFPPAMYRFGALILGGKCAEKNRIEAFRNIVESAQAGYPRAICLFGAMALAGEGTHKDIENAKNQFQIANKKGEPAGAFGLAVIYLIQGKASAWKFLKKSAEEGYSDAEIIYAEFVTEKEEKDRLIESGSKGGIEKESIFPLQMLLKGTKISPTIEGIIKAFKELREASPGHTAEEPEE